MHTRSDKPSAVIRSFGADEHYIPTLLAVHLRDGEVRPGHPCHSANKMQAVA